MVLGLFGKSSSQKALEAQNEQVKQNWKYQKAQFEYNWGIDADSVAEDGTGGIQTFKDDDSGRKKGAQWDEYYYNVDQLEKRKAADTEQWNYQTNTAQQNWDMGKSQQEYEWDQQDKYYDKNVDQFDSQIKFNQTAYNDALAREQLVFEEQVLKAAFDNQGLIADLYEATGSAGYEQAAKKLGILNFEKQKELQESQKLTSLKQNIGSSRYREAGVNIEQADKAGKTQFEEASLVQDLAIKESSNRFKKAGLLIDSNQTGRGAEFENELITRQNNATYAKAAHESQERTIASLKAQGEASLLAAGRSQGKAVQSVLAELGRQNAYIAETLVRGSGIAEARAKQIQKTALTSKEKASLQIDKLDRDTFDNIQNTLLTLEESKRNLKVSDSKSTLNLDEIKKAVFDNIENTSLDVKVLENNLKHAQTTTALDLKEIDWNIDNLGSRFATNQDILKTSLDSAVAASALNIQDITRDRAGADLEAEAKKMIDPSLGRAELNLDHYQPLALPKAKYTDPSEPKLPPAPLKGAIQDSSTGAVGTLKSAAGAAITGFSTAAALKSADIITGAATPWGWALTAASFLLGE